MLALLSISIAAFAAGCGVTLVLCKLLMLRTPGGAQERRAAIALHTIARQLSHDVLDHDERVRAIGDALENDPAPEASDVLASVCQILEAGEQMRRKLAESQKLLDEQAQLLRATSLAAKMDPLTQLWNRGALDMYLSERLAALKERNETTSLMMLDIDRFKRLNDTHGHVAGDAALKAVAQAVTDSAPVDAFVARYGGEELVVVFPNKTAQESRLVAEAIRARIGETTARIDGKSLRVTASAGLAELRTGDSAGAWIHRADEGLYDAKSRGRNVGVWRCGDAMLPFRDAGIGAPVVHASSHSPDEAGIDPVTGVSTKAAFLADLERRQAQYRRSPAPACVVLIEIADYDALISKRGFKIAEQALLFVSRTLRASIRQSDHVCRYGRNAFAMFLPEATLEDAQPILARVCEGLEIPFATIESVEVGLTASCGVAALDPSQEAAANIERCRKALGETVASV